MDRPEQKEKKHVDTATATQPWTLPWEDILHDFRVTTGNGLNPLEVKKRRHRFGLNRIHPPKRKSGWTILVAQLKNFIVALLAAAAVLSFAFSKWMEGISIAVAIVINVGIGFFTELNAVRSMESLHRLSRASAKVRREGQIQEISAEQLVPGDIVILDGGDIVAADLRLIEASRLRVNESALTGESLPVSKKVDRLPEDIPLADRRNMLFKGTAVTSGSGHGVVVATGMQTELGRISSLAEESAEEETPLEKRLVDLGHKLIGITLAVAALIAVTGIIGGVEFFLIIETALALAVAAIPEGLPIVATIALARGMWRLANRNALINRLSAVETLGATSIICTDKTGTLTENRMTVTRIAPAAEESGEIEVKGEAGHGVFYREGEALHSSNSDVLREILEIGVLCNNAGLARDVPKDEERAVGDPLEIALLSVGMKAGIHREKLLETLPEVREEAFDAESKMMATFHKNNDDYRVAVKGAPESILQTCTFIRTPEREKKLNQEMRRQWFDRNNQMAEAGLRVLGMATKRCDTADADPYEKLIFVGLLALLDPPRKDVNHAVAVCKDAGIRVIMVTGDQPATAKNVGLDVGLIEGDKTVVVHGKDIKNPDQLSQEEQANLLQANIFARVTPRQKLDLIILHQKNGSVVAMTGDGVNDAPALKKADIGVAMGRGGTQVAREAADMVLKDNAFRTIVVAVEQGRAIFDNIRKFILYLLSGNVSEIMIVGLALAAGAPLPILPLQILYLNMIGDVFPALALGVGKGDPTKMKHSPRDPREPIMTSGHWFAVVGYGCLITLAVLIAFALALHWISMDAGQAVTISFLTLAFARLWHVFNMRDRGSGLIRNDITRNPFVWGALALCTGLLLAAVYLPGLSLVLDIVKPGVKGWTLILGMSLVPWGVGQVWQSRGKNKI